MIGTTRTPAEKRHDDAAWAALVSGAADLAANPIPEEPMVRIVIFYMLDGGREDRCFEAATVHDAKVAAKDWLDEQMDFGPGHFRFLGFGLEQRNRIA